MPQERSVSDELRAQIRAVADRDYPTEAIESRIAASLCAEGHFIGTIDAGELAVILRHVVYDLFSDHKFAGFNLKLVHNVPSMKVAIRNGEANIKYVVHIHKPIVAFLTFGYTLVNDAVEVDRKVRLKRGSLKYGERTRRLDLKARTALAAVNVKEIALRELQDVSQAILNTLPHQLEKQGLSGQLKRINLFLEDSRLNVHLEGDFSCQAPNLPATGS